VAERAYQHALAYAKERVQSRPVDGSVKGPATIIHHPDVRRMLMTMRALTEGSRAMASTAAAAYDAAHHHPDAEVRAQNQAFYEFMVPLVKGYSTEMSLEVTSLGVQVHGGMGFIEETGAAQHYRDARILTIYEGTTAIQANDIVGRKTVRDGGAVALALCAEVATTEEDLAAHSEVECAIMRHALRGAREMLVQSINHIVANAKTNPKAVYAGAVNYLQLAGVVLCGWQMARAMRVALDRMEDDPDFYAAKLVTARFYAESVLPTAYGLATSVVVGGDTIAQAPVDMF
jgi:hypothetical protein